MIISKRLARWIGLRTTAYHIRIFGYAINRFALSMAVAAIGAALFFYGWLAVESRPYDFILGVIGVLVCFIAFRIDNRWFREMFGENPNKITKII